MDKKLGVLGIITLVLAGFGGTQYLEVQELDRAYVCPLTKEIGFFDRLSSSGKTGYYYDTNGTEIGVKCRSGRTYAPWMDIRTYASMNNVSINDIVKSSYENEYAEVCGKDGCWQCQIPLHAYSKCKGTLNRAGEIILP